MVKLVYPELEALMNKKHLNVKQVIDKAGLNYSALCPKLTQRGGLSLKEAIAIKGAVKSRSKLEDLFSEVS